MRELGQDGIDLIKSFEGCRLEAYKPVPTEKYWTIGWGHYGPDIYEGMTITQEEADAMFVSDLARYVAPVNNPDYVTITYELNQNQFDALVSFCYNCGPNALREIAKGKRIPAEIAAELPKYNKGGGKVLPGLVRRREAELELFNKEDDEEMRAWETLQARIEQLESDRDTHLKTLEAHVERINELESKHCMDVPDWAKEAVDKAVAKGYINTPDGGSLDFYRFVTVMNNANVFDK